MISRLAYRIHSALMKTSSAFPRLLTGLVCAKCLAATVGPFSPEIWPATVNPQKKVHYVSTDGMFLPVSSSWRADELKILTGGDQTTEAVTIGGHSGVKAIGGYLNVADASFREWANSGVIDILMQVYGNEAVLDVSGQTRSFSFLTGTLPELNSVAGGSLPVVARNQKWSWVLFRIPNGIRKDGTRFVGSIPANADSNAQFGGVNGGTIRLGNVPGLIVRAIAFGEQGAFGEPEQINVFAPGEVCDPEPQTNLVSLDLNKGMTNHLVVLNDSDQTVTFADNVGPANDRRRAVRPNGTYLNFGITDNYLGQPCNEPRTVKICLEYYDDPALTGVVFGPEAYATDALGGTGMYPVDRRQKLEGTGQWVRRSFSVPAVNLKGVNAGSLTAGPRLVFQGGKVFLSSVDLAVLRVGNHSLANQDPLADCNEDPKICTGAYGNYAELDLAKGIRNGLAPGTSGGDQEMIIAEAGPPGDRRLAVRPALNDGTPGFDHNFLNFAITGNALGPSSQPNAHLAICLTYYDDPALAGATFRPVAYSTERDAQLITAFTVGGLAATLEGTGKWREAYFEISDVKFNGVNQGPQAAARFNLSDKIFVSRVRYAVIRPCGASAGVNLLESCKPPPESIFSLTDGFPDMFTPRVGFQRTNHIVSTSVFHWYAGETGQQNGPWRPLSGRPKWSGEPEFWKQQIKQMMAANIDVLYVHLIPSFEEQRINLFKALNQLRREGCAVPRVAPFLDPMITWDSQTLDLATASTKQAFISQYVRFFNQYFSVNHDRFADDYLARIDGRIVLDTWHVKFTFVNLSSLARKEVEDALKNAFVANHPAFTNGIYLITTAISQPTLSFADEKVAQFENTGYFDSRTFAGVTSVQLKGGYWNQNINNPGLFLPRNGGVPYANAWAQVDRTTVNRVYLESWNEYAEGSGLYAVMPHAAPYITPGSGNTNTDVWSLTYDPYEYIETTAAGAARFNDGGSNDAIVLWHNLPDKMMAGENKTATVIVRNEGNNRWSSSRGYFFAQETNQNSALFGSERYPLDDTADEIPTYSGIFRGRPKAFSLTLTAPQQPGTYLTHWRMHQQNIGGFGQSITAEITVEAGVEKPLINVQPQSQAVVAGASLTFTVTASGTAPLSYQWRKNGANIPGATSSNYSVSSVQPADAGLYTVEVKNTVGTAVSLNATLSLIIPPTITVQPQSQTAAVGSTVTLSVAATGSVPLNYQWRKSGVPVTGATARTYTISSVQISDAGFYSVLVSNAAGSVASDVGTLTVLNPPLIRFQTGSHTAAAGAPDRLAVSASGSAPLNFQWQKGGSNILGATSDSYAFPYVQVSDVGTYRVAVSNALGTVLSSNLVLTVVTNRIIPSINDLWDISQGVQIVAHSPFSQADGRPNPYDARDIFGGRFSNYTLERECCGGVVFVDSVSTNYIHFVEWITPVPVRIDSIHLFASGDGSREFARFTIAAKSLGSSTYDLNLYTLTPSHPFVILDQLTWLLLSTNLVPVTAQEFRAEFLNYPNQAFTGPHILELDGFGEIPPLLQFDLTHLKLGGISGLRLKVNSLRAGPLRIEVSTNLLEWLPLVIFPSVPELFEFIDPSATNYPLRFYRAVRP